NGGERHVKIVGVDLGRGHQLERRAGLFRREKGVRQPLAQRRLQLVLEAITAPGRPVDRPRRVGVVQHLAVRVDRLGGAESDGEVLVLERVAVALVVVQEGRRTRGELVVPDGVLAGGNAGRVQGNWFLRYDQVGQVAQAQAGERVGRIRGVDLRRE